MRKLPAPIRGRVLLAVPGMVRERELAALVEVGRPNGAPYTAGDGSPARIR